MPNYKNGLLTKVNKNEGVVHWRPVQFLDGCGAFCQTHPWTHDAFSYDAVILVMGGPKEIRDKISKFFILKETQYISPSRPSMPQTYNMRRILERMRGSGLFQT